MGDLVIREAAVGDLAACAAIVNADIDARGFMPRTITVEDIEAMFVPGLLEARVLLVADCGGTVLGYLSSEPTGDVRGFYVRADAQGKGVGKALMDGAKARFPAGLRLTVFEPNMGGRRFYAREAFVDTGVRSVDDGVPVMHLKWVPR
jgi:GNAT superfamily N-acetyltransferase